MTPPPETDRGLSLPKIGCFPDRRRGSRAEILDVLFHTVQTGDLEMTLTARAGADRSTPAPNPTPPPGVVLRMARWSTRHRAKAIIGWFLFVALVMVAGQAAGTRLLEGAETGTGESGRADRVVEGAGYPATPTENVLIQSRSGSLDAATATAVAGELGTRLRALPQVADVGRLTRSADGRSALVPVVLDVKGATGNAAQD